MNREDIIRMAREAKIYDLLADEVIKYGELELFASLVAAAERDACANVCSDLLKNQVVRSWATQNEMEAFSYCADKIRNRGKA